MKRTLFALVVIGGLAVSGWFWLRPHKPEEAKPAEEKAEESRVKHDDAGRVVINMDDETQGNMGLLVAKPAAAKISPEIKGYGRVLDPGPLAALMTEIASARAAGLASSNELVRVKTLAPQGNASERALQAAETAAVRDQLALQSARDRLNLAWSRKLAEQFESSGLLPSIVSQEAVLARIDTPVGDTPKTAPTGARIANLAGDLTEAEFLGVAPAVDPQTLGRGFLFLIRTNSHGFAPGEALTAYLTVAGEPADGVLIPRDAVIRTEGAAWVYVLNSASDSFTRIQVALDHPVEAGWLVEKGVAASDYVVVAGAQTLLSEELKGALKAD